MMDDAVNNNNVVNDSDELFREYKETKSVEVRKQNCKQISLSFGHTCQKFLNRGIDYEDIYQVASIALIKAVERFDPDKGVKFISFATPTIIGEIKRYFRDKGSVIRIPRRIYEVYQKINHARESLTQELKRPPRIDELARHLNISEESVVEIIESYNAL